MLRYMGKGPCRIRECENEMLSMGLCHAHYQKLWKYGHPEIEIYRKVSKCKECLKETGNGASLCRSCYVAFVFRWKYRCDSLFREKLYYYGRHNKKRNKRRGSKKGTCEIIYAYAHDPEIQNDPEALGTEYIENACGVKCQKLEREANNF